MKHQNFLANLKFIITRKCNETKVYKTDVPDKTQNEDIQNSKLDLILKDLDKAFAN